MTFDVLYPSGPKELTRLGVSAAVLLHSKPQWILRRKEKVTLLDETTVRRQMSVDFVVPGSQKPLGFIDGKPVSYAPLLFLQKGMDDPFDPQAPLQSPQRLFANFDLRDDCGKAMSLPPREWNGLVTSRMLATELGESLRRHPSLQPDLRVGMEAILHQLSTADQLTAEKLLESLQREENVRGEEWTASEAELLRLYRADHNLARMINLSTSASVVMFPLLGEDGRHGVVKLSYDEQVTALSPTRTRWRPFLAALGWGGYELWVVSPYVGAESFHFEFQAPSGLELYDAGLVEIDSRSSSDGEPRDGPTLDRVSGYASRLHLYAPSVTPDINVFAWIRLRVRRQEFVGGAAIAGVLVAATMWGAWLLSDSDELSPTSVPTLLLLAPSFIVAYAVRPGPHRLTTRMLKNARWIVGLSGLLPFVAAGLLAFTPRDGDPGLLTSYGFRCWWLYLAIAALVLAGTLVGSVLFPLPEIKKARLRNWRSRRAQGD